jgi:hypothetical protein
LSRSIIVVPAVWTAAWAALITVLP